MGHALMENRHGLIVGAVATLSSGHAGRLAALHLIEPHAGRAQRLTVGADKGFDAEDFVAELRESNVTAHVARNDNGRHSAINGRTTRHPGYAVSLSHPQAHRGGVRLGQNGGRAAQGAPSRTAQDRLAVHLRHGRLQLGPAAQAARSGGVTPGLRPEPQKWSRVLRPRA